jgi:hypothetical protein
MTTKALCTCAVLIGALGRVAAAAPTAVEYAIPSDIVSVAPGDVGRLNVVNGDGVSAGDVNGRTCQVELNWGDAQGQLLFPAPATFTLGPGQSSFLDWFFDQAAAPGATSGSIVMLRPMMHAVCSSTLVRRTPALLVTLEVFDSQSGRSSLLIRGNTVTISGNLGSAANR